VTTDSETARVHTGDLSAERVTVTCHGTAPERVAVDGKRATEVEADPDVGEWCSTGDVFVAVT